MVGRQAQRPYPSLRPVQSVENQRRPDVRMRVRPSMKRESDCIGPTSLVSCLQSSTRNLGTGLHHGQPLCAKPLQSSKNVSKLKGYRAEIGDSLRKVDILGTILRAVSICRRMGKLGVRAQDGFQIAQDDAVGQSAAGIVVGQHRERRGRHRSYPRAWWLRARRKGIHSSDGGLRPHDRA
jgi:hypothetical protein